jgi:hypothetical protein
MISFAGWTKKLRMHCTDNCGASELKKKLLKLDSKTPSCICIAVATAIWFVVAASLLKGKADVSKADSVDKI